MGEIETIRVLLEVINKYEGSSIEEYKEIHKVANNKLLEKLTQL